MRDSCAEKLDKGDRDEGRGTERIDQDGDRGGGGVQGRKDQERLWLAVYLWVRR